MQAHIFFECWKIHRRKFRQINVKRIFQLRDIPRSLHFLRRAVKREFSNVFATLDLLGVMISSVSEHLAEIEEVIQLYLERIKDGFTGLTESELKWILGCAKFMTVSDKEDAVTVWISGQELNPTKNAFAVSHLNYIEGIYDSFIFFGS